MDICSIARALCVTSALAVLLPACVSSDLATDLGDLTDTGADGPLRDTGSMRDTGGGRDVAADTVVPDPDVPGDTVSTDTGPTDTGASDIGSPDVPPSNQPPNAAVATPLQGFVGDELTFDGSGSTDPDGTVVEWRWFFGDGAMGTGEVATHAYATAGVYAGRLEVVDDDGATSDVMFRASVAAAGDGPVAVIAFPDEVGLVGTSTTFDGTGSWDPSGGTIVTYTWTVESSLLDAPISLDGSTPSLTFDAYGMYDVSLDVVSDGGGIGSATEMLRVGVGPEAAIDATGPHEVGVPSGFSGGGSTDVDGVIVEHAWDFGDGGSASGADVEHAFATAGSHVITLTVTDDDGFAATAMHTVNVVDGGSDNLPPTAEAGPPLTGRVGDTLTFDSAGSVDPDGTIAMYRWDFGDGGISEGARVFHTYAAVGTFTATLTVTDDDGAVATDTTTVTIGENAAPVASIAGGDRTAAVGETLAFDGAGSSDVDGSIVSFGWDFGDGTTGSGATPSHAWSSAGSFTVTLTVTDDEGATGSATVTVTVEDIPNTSPTAVIDASPDSPSVGATVSFSGTGSSDPDGDALVTYTWDFGDGGTGSGATTSHAYASAGTFTATLSVTDARGATGMASTTVTVTDTPTYNGLFRVRPFDDETPVDAACNDVLTITVGPVDCTVDVAGSNMTMTCGADIYRGTITGSSFTVVMDRRDQYSGLDCGDVYFEETITGTFISEDRWEGSSSLALRMVFPDPAWGCYDCVFDPFQKTGTRL